MNTRPELHRTSSNPSVSAEGTAGTSRDKTWKAFIQKLLDNLQEIQSKKKNCHLITFSFRARNDEGLKSKLRRASDKDNFVERLINAASKDDGSTAPFTREDIKSIPNSWETTKVQDLVEVFFDLSDLQQYLIYINQEPKYQDLLHERMKEQSDKKQIFPSVFMNLCEEIRIDKKEDDKIGFSQEDIKKIMEKADFPDEEPDEGDEEPDEGGASYKIVGTIWS
jgi:hypothetical protein